MLESEALNSKLIQGVATASNEDPLWTRVCPSWAEGSATVLVIVSVDPDTAVVIPVPPAIVTVESAALAVYEPVSPARILRTSWTTLGESLVIVIAPAFRLVEIPDPPVNVRLSVVVVAVVVPLSAPRVVNTF